MLIKVKVFPGVGEGGIVKKSADSFEIRVREKAERGLANQAVIQILASYFRIPISQIRLIKGVKTRNKIFEIRENFQSKI